MNRFRNSDEKKKEGALLFYDLVHSLIHFSGREECVAAKRPLIQRGERWRHVWLPMENHKQAIISAKELLHEEVYIQNTGGYCRIRAVYLSVILLRFHLCLSMLGFSARLRDAPLQFIGTKNSVVFFLRNVWNWWPRFSGESSPLGVKAYRKTRMNVTFERLGCLFIHAYQSIVK